MITIAEPQEHIDKLWGKQKIREGDTYRMMRYVLRVDHEDKVLLHNVVTGRLVVLEREEAEALETLPHAYSPVMEQLVTEHYLVPEGYDEHRQVINLRTILRKMDEAQQPKGGLLHYTILPTTACNARCYYCFEHGSKIVSMSEETANDVVSYITKSHLPEREISIRWFGGEPTLASDRIDQICNGLFKNGVRFRSRMTSNGYLFDKEMVCRAKDIWNLNSIMITVDGTEKTYNEVKAYVGVHDNPYQRVFRNIELLIQNKIHVGLRMNISVNNHKEFEPLVREVKERIGKSSFLQLYVHPLSGDCIDSLFETFEENETWFQEKLIELNDIIREYEKPSVNEWLPTLRYSGCLATSSLAVTITPKGNLVRCPEQFSEAQITGNIWEGETNSELVSAWKEYADIAGCQKCVAFPDCLRIAHCATKRGCRLLPELLKRFSLAAIARYKRFCKN